MSNNIKINLSSLNAEEKLSVYEAARQLFSQGYSHPQVVQMLSTKIDGAGALLVTDKAFKEEWNKLHVKAAQLFADNKIRSEVIDELSKDEPYADVVAFLVDDLYNRNIDYLDSNSESEKKSRVWAYMFGLGIIQVIRYYSSPYNTYLFYAFVLLTLAGLAWGVKELFFNKKDEAVLQRHVLFETYKKQWKKAQSEIYSQEKNNGF